MNCKLYCENILKKTPKSDRLSSGGHCASSKKKSHTSKQIRNPFPIPDLTREGRWYEGRPFLAEGVDPRDRGWHLGLEPHTRLFSHQTLSSARKNWHYRTCSKQPQDFLDLALTSVYEHHKDLWLPKQYCYIQPETINKETWRVLRNKIKIHKKTPVSQGYDIKYAVNEKKAVGTKALGITERVRQRVHPCSLQLAAEGPHTDRTNPGFSRKIDGTHYGI